MGIWSCLGTDVAAVKESLFNGKSGIGLDEARLTYGYRSGLTGIVETPVITKQMLDRHTRAGMSEEAQYAYMASRQAFEQAMVDDNYLREHEVGCIFGNDSSAKPVIESAKIMDEKHDSAMLGYGLIFQSMNSTVNMNLSTIFHLRGVNFTISAACASGSHSIGLGYMMIQQGLQDIQLGADHLDQELIARLRIRDGSLTRIRILGQTVVCRDRRSFGFRELLQILIFQQPFRIRAIRVEPVLHQDPRNADQSCAVQHTVPVVVAVIALLLRDPARLLAAHHALDGLRDLQPQHITLAGNTAACQRVICTLRIARIAVNAQEQVTPLRLLPAGDQCEILRLIRTGLDDLHAVAFQLRFQQKVELPGEL